MRTLLLAFLLVSTCGSVWSSSLTAFAFPPGRNGGWTEVTGAVGLTFNSRIIAVADWTNSKMADLITVNGNNTVEIYTWQSGPHVFQKSAAFEFNNEGILSAVVADLNRDGRVDLAVVTTSGKLHIVYGPDQVAMDVMPNIPLHKSIPHLNVLNLYGRCAMPDLVVLTEAGHLTVLRNRVSGGCDHIGRPTFVAESNISLSDANMALKLGAVDFRGECRSQFISPASSSNAIKTVLTVSETPDDAPSQTFSVPSFFGASSYGDLDGDGAIDIVYPACMKPTVKEGTTDVFECVAYDAVAIVRNGISGSVCSSDSCCAGHGSRLPTVTYSAAKGYTVTNGQFQIFPFRCQVHNPFPPEPTTTSAPDEVRRQNTDAHVGDFIVDAAMLDLPLYPPVIRLFDYNRDTRIDLLIATTWGPMVLTNEGGAGFVCNALDAQASKNSEAFRSSIPFPFDITEDGSIDVVAFPTTPNGTITAYWNGYGVDEDYFFTATMLNGVEGDGFPYWGAIQPGAVHRFQWQNVDTETRTGTITQYATSAAHMLLLPHAHFGLARTFSPIQNYGTGVRNGQPSNYYRDWTAYLMPNSQVVVLANPIDDPSGWTLRLFLYALEYKKIILIALPTVLAMIGIPILVLKCKEMKYDKAEKRQQMS